MPTLTDGWATMADGLHIHRWYLHTEPYRRDRATALQECHRQIQGSASSLTVPEAEAVVETFGAGLAEHLFRQQLPDEIVAALRRLQPPARQVMLAGRRVIAVPGDCIRPLGDVDAAQPALLWPQSLYSGAPVLSRELADQVSALVEVPRLAFILNLAADVIVHGEQGAGTLPGTVALAPSADPVTYAERLLDASAYAFATLVIETRGMYLGGPTVSPPDPEGTWKSPDSGSLVPAKAIIAEIFSASILFRFFSCLAAEGNHEVGSRLAAQRNAVDSYRPFVYDVADSVDNMNIADMITIYYPGERQYEKYQDGTGPGQG